MATNNRRVAAYLPPDIDERLRRWMERKGMKSESQAIIQILESVLGRDEKLPAIDRLTRLEMRLEIVEKALAEKPSELLGVTGGGSE